ncbi:hypothetical protein WA158_008535 [Blastocystis sp. Blastoise]
MRVCNAVNVWPLPQKMIEDGQSIQLSKTFTIVSTSASSVVSFAIEKYKNIIGVGLDDSGFSKLEIIIRSKNEKLALDTQYGYNITLSNDHGTLSTESVYGVLYGLETFSQLIVNNTITHNKVEIVDFPDYVHRGIMIDTGRRFIPVHTVKMLLDSMPYNKLNVLHFHLSDFCRVSIESKHFPELTAGLTGLQGGFYTQEEIKDIIEYARLRGVRVIPEIDIPGHSLGFKPMDIYGMEFCDESKQQLYGDSEGHTYKLLTTYLEEILSLFPEPFVHLGCDETQVHGRCNVETAASLEKQIFDFVYNTLGKRPIAWEESLFIKHSMIPAGVVSAWTQHVNQEVIDAGYDSIENYNGIFYLNNVWASYNNMWVDIKHLSLSSNNHGTNKAQLFGGEVSMWTDNYCYINQCGAWSGDLPIGYKLYDPSYDTQFEESIMSIIYPRAIIAAGSFWHYDNSIDKQSSELLELYKMANTRLIERNIMTCPSECTCNEITKCGKNYIE